MLIWLWSSRNNVIATTRVHLQLTERGHLRSTPLPPWAAMHLAQRCYHFWKHFLELLLWNIFQCRSHIFWTFSLSLNIHPLKADFISGNRSYSEPYRGGRGDMVVVPFQYFIFWPETAWLYRKNRVSWSIVMMENPIIGPNFRPFFKPNFM